MPTSRVARRQFIKELAGSAAVASVLPRRTVGQAPPVKPVLKFAVIGINHSHINSQVGAVLRGGGELVSVYAKEPDLLDAFVKRFPQAKRAREEKEILEDPSIRLVLSSGIPVDRAPLG